MIAVDPLPTDAIAARRRPLLLLSVFTVEAIAAWVLSTPWGEAISGIVGAHPDGDRALWWSRGHLLIGDFLGRHHGTVTALFRATMVGLAAYFVLSLFTLGALLGALSDAPRFSLRRAAARGGELFGRLALIEAVAIFAIGVVVALVGVIPAMIISGRTSTLHDPRVALCIDAIPLVFAALAAVYLFSLFDLARAIVARHDRTAMRAIFLSMRAPGAVSSQVALSIPRWVASAGLVGFGAAFSTASASVTLIFLVHQAVAFARLALRGSILARALRLSDVADVAPPGDR